MFQPHLQKLTPLFLIQVFALIIGAAYLPQKSHAQQDSPEGFLATENYSAKTYDGQPQNWGITQDKRGVIYIANNGGIIEYDGTNWRTIELNNKNKVRSIATDDQGTIYAGGYSEFGVLVPDAKGNLEFQSLVPDSLKPEYQDFGDVWNTIVLNDKVYFQARSCIFVLSQGKVSVIPPINADGKEKAFQTSFVIDGEIFVSQFHVGLLKLVGSSLRTIYSETFPSDARVLAMFPTSETEALLFTLRQGSYKLTRGDNPQIEPIQLPVDSFLKTNPPYSGTLINRDRFAIGTRGGGCVIINQKGEVERVFTKKTGLQNEDVVASFLDKDSQLWLALQNGVSKVDIESPVTFFSDKSGLSGTIQAITKHKKDLYVATTSGVFYLEPQATDFQKIESVSVECWSLLSIENPNDTSLLLAANDQIIEIFDDRTTAKIVKAFPWTLLQSKTDPNKVLVGLDPGLLILERKNKKWQPLGLHKEVQEVVHNMAQDQDGTIWLGTLKQGILKMSFSANHEDTIITKYPSKTKGVPEEFCYLKAGQDQVYFGSQRGLLRYEAAADSFVFENKYELGITREQSGVHRISEDPSGKMWLISFHEETDLLLGYMAEQSSGKYTWNRTPFLKTTDDYVQAIYHDDESITWYGGSGNLFRFDATKESNLNHEFNTLIRQVIIGSDTLFYGTNFNTDKITSLFQPPSLLPQLEFSKEKIEFHFSALNFDRESANQYSWKLEGQDEAWAEWNSEVKVTYNNLSENNYTFQVKARDLYGKESPIATYEFVVSPPWYRRWWAYLGYVLAFIGFVYGAVTYSTQRLRLMVKNATAEIIQQKEEIELQSKLVEEKNKDITDSIEYASTIQSAILPTKEFMNKLLAEHFVLFKPRDIVSGDFYWINKVTDTKIVIVAADCTGHGVPGAFMSMIGNSLLNEIILEKGIAEADQILNRLKAGIIKALKQDGSEGQAKDGMDIALAVYDRETSMVEFAGANNPIYITSERSTFELADGRILEPVITNKAQTKNLFEIKGDKQPIGYQSERNHPFTSHQFKVQKGEAFFLFTDGYADQFGGPKGKKFMYKSFKKLILALQEKSMPEQERILNKTIEEWSAGLEQVDDICIAGVRI